MHPIECKRLESDLKNNIAPQICGKSRGKVTVCCPTISEEMCRKHSREATLASRFESIEAGDRIINGSVAKLGEFPHFAVLGYGDIRSFEITWQCGGTLISKDYVLTAAHCLSKNYLPIVVQLGDIVLDSFRGKTYKIKHITTHPDYNNERKHHDIGLIQLMEDVEFSQYIKPACLPPNKVTDIKKTLIVCGFGLTENFGSQPDTLLKTDLRFFTNAECKSKFQKLIINEDFQICFGSKSDRKDSCDGDSGGPLQRYDNSVGLHRVIGIVSFGALGSCGTPGLPGVYTRVSHYVPWIEKIVWKQR